MIRLYRWDTSRTIFGIAYADLAAREALLQRLQDRMRERAEPLTGAGADLPIESVANERTRDAWARAARLDGATVVSVTPPGAPSATTRGRFG